MCHTLVNAGASVATQDLYGCTPVDYAKDAGFDQCAYELQARGAINGEDVQPQAQAEADQPVELQTDSQVEEPVVEIEPVSDITPVQEGMEVGGVEAEAQIFGQEEGLTTPAAPILAGEGVAHAFPGTTAAADQGLGDAPSYEGTVLYSYEAANENEMSLFEGEQIYVTLASDEYQGWWFGCKYTNTQEYAEHQASAEQQHEGENTALMSGWFPAQFVHVPELPQVTAPPATPQSPAHPFKALSHGKSKDSMLGVFSMGGGVTHSPVMPFSLAAAQAGTPPPKNLSLSIPGSHSVSDNLQEQPESTKHDLEQAPVQAERLPNALSPVDEQRLREQTMQDGSRLPGGEGGASQSAQVEAQEQVHTHAPEQIQMPPPSPVEPPAASAATSHAGETSVLPVVLEAQSALQAVGEQQQQEQQRQRQQQQQQQQQASAQAGAPQGSTQAAVLETSSAQAEALEEELRRAQQDSEARVEAAKAKAERAQRLLEEMQARQRDLESVLQAHEKEKENEIERAKLQAETSRSAIEAQLQELSASVATERTEKRELENQAEAWKEAQMQELAQLKARLEEERQEAETKMHSMAQDRSELQSRMEDMKEMVAQALGRAEQSEGMLQEAKTREDTLSRELEGRMRSLREELEKERQQRSSLHNTVLDLKGKIRVYVRVREAAGSEEPEACRTEGNNAISVAQPARGSAQSLDGARGGSQSGATVNRKVFNFDGVLGSDACQPHIFQEVSPLVTSCVDGYNVCIFAYGQTGSGKTYTMFGDERQFAKGGASGSLQQHSGIAPRAIFELFNQLQIRREQRSKVTDMTASPTVAIQMLEVYRDGIYDVLSGSVKSQQGPQAVTVKLTDSEATDASQGLGEMNGSGYSGHVLGSSSYHVVVSGAAERTASSAEEALKILGEGFRNRSTSATLMNKASSRSHLVARLTVRIPESPFCEKVARMTFVDLAGSERVERSGVAGAALKEAQSINKSLSALADVVSALTCKSEHVPYRNHPLTMLMADSLGGNAKTLMFVCVSPLASNAAESVSSLTFARRCKNVANRATMASTTIGPVGKVIKKTKKPPVHA